MERCFTLAFSLLLKLIASFQKFTRKEFGFRGRRPLKLLAMDLCSWNSMAVLLLKLSNQEGHCFCRIYIGYMIFFLDDWPCSKGGILFESGRLVKPNGWRLHRETLKGFPRCFFSSSCGKDPSTIVSRYTCTSQGSWNHQIGSQFQVSLGIRAEWCQKNRVWARLKPHEPRWAAGNGSRTTSESQICMTSGIWNIWKPNNLVIRQKTWLFCKHCFFQGFRCWRYIYIYSMDIYNYIIQLIISVIPWNIQWIYNGCVL